MVGFKAIDTQRPTSVDVIRVLEYYAYNKIMDISKNKKDAAFFQSHSLSKLSDIPGDPGSQLPYQEFPPYYLHPIRLVFSHWRSSWVLGFAWVLFLSL